MFRKIWLTFVILPYLCATVLAADRPVVLDVAAFREGDGARIEIRADKPLTHTSYLMPELAKWVIDLPGAASAAPGDQSRKMKTAPLERISVRQKEVNGDPLTRIGIDFKGEVEFSIKADPTDPGRLVVLLIPSGKTTPQKQGQGAPAAPPRPLPLSTKQ